MKCPVLIFFAGLAGCYQSEGNRFEGSDVGQDIMEVDQEAPEEVEVVDQTDVDLADDGAEDTPLLCGNGMVDEGEECDDGNMDDCDGCASCHLEQALHSNASLTARTSGQVPCQACPLTIETWFKLETDGPYFSLVDIPDNISIVVDNWGFQYDLTNGMMGSGWGHTEEGPTYLMPNSWHHLALVCDWRSLFWATSLYLDGVFVEDYTSGEISCSGISINGPMTIASQGTISPFPYVPGTVDDFRISNEAIYDTYGVTFTPERYLSVQPNTVALWNFNSAEGGIIRDLSANGYDLELVNGNLVADECHGR